MNSLKSFYTIHVSTVLSPSYFYLFYVLSATIFNSSTITSFLSPILPLPLLHPSLPQTSQCMIFCRTNVDCNNLEYFLNNTDTEGKPIFGKRNTGKVRFDAVQYSSVYCSAVQCSTVLYSTVQYSTLQYSTTQCSIVQHSAV